MADYLENAYNTFAQVYMLIYKTFNVDHLREEVLSGTGHNRQCDTVTVYLTNA